VSVEKLQENEHATLSSFLSKFLFGHFHRGQNLRGNTATDIWFRFRYLFICQGTSTKRQWRVLFGLRVKLPPVTIPVLPFKGRDNLIKCLVWGHNKRSCRPISTL